MTLRLRSESGFTLPEILVVIIIIGVLAAIALPSFLNRVDHGYDASAKSDASAMAGSVEQCVAMEDDYRLCDTKVELFGTDSDGGLPWGSAIGQVAVTKATPKGYEVVAWSKSTTKYTVERRPNGPQVRSCDHPAEGSCPPGGNW